MNTQRRFKRHPAEPAVGGPIEPAIRAGRPLARVAARALVGIPSLAIASLIAIATVNRSPTPGADANIALRAPAGEHAMALVFGARSGVHLVRVTDAPRTIPADLDAGPLRVVAFHRLHLQATDVADPNVVRFAATGPVLQLRSLLFDASVAELGR